MEIFTDDAEIMENYLFLRGKDEIAKFMWREAPKLDDHVIEKLNIFEKQNEIAVE